VTVPLLIQEGQRARAGGGYRSARTSLTQWRKSRGRLANRPYANFEWAELFDP
jgi:hypothetical protein